MKLNWTSFWVENETHQELKEEIVTSVDCRKSTGEKTVKRHSTSRLTAEAAGQLALELGTTHDDHLFNLQLSTDKKRVSQHIETGSDWFEIVCFYISLNLCKLFRHEVVVAWRSPIQTSYTKKCLHQNVLTAFVYVNEGSERRLRCDIWFVCTYHEWVVHSITLSCQMICTFVEFLQAKRSFSFRGPIISCRLIPWCLWWFLG